MSAIDFIDPVASVASVYRLGLLALLGRLLLGLVIAALASAPFVAGAIRGAPKREDFD